MQSDRPIVRLVMYLLGLMAAMIAAQYLLFSKPPAPARRGITLKPEKERVVPSIVHYTWYSLHKNTFRFHHYMSVLSAHKILKPRTIFFWCGKLPQGLWWSRVLQEVPELKVRVHPEPTEIFGRPVRIPEHQSDIVRLNAIIDHGGIYLDLDALVLRSFEPLLYYNLTMGYQKDGSGLCNGIIVARPNDRFLKLWLQEYHHFLDRKWDYLSVQFPGTLAARYPELIHIEERTFHRPNFVETAWIYSKNRIYPWRRNFAMHLWYRFYNVDHTPEDIKQLNSTLGQMFRFIYYDLS